MLLGQSLAVLAVLCAWMLDTSAAAQAQELYLRSHSLQAPFIDADLTNRYWEFGGSTVVSTNHYVRLTPDRQSKKGWLWSKLPFTYSNWAVEFEFKVEGQGAKLFGDGFAFWVTQERAETGPAFGGRDQFRGLGIFFDTYANTRHRYSFPYVSAMLNDGTEKFSVDDDNEKFSLAGCEAHFRKVNFPTKAKVKLYLGKLTVSLDIKGRNEWEECFSVDGVTVDGANYLGFSAMTGDVADNHDVIRVTSYMITPPPEDVAQALIKTTADGVNREVKKPAHSTPKSTPSSSSETSPLVYVFVVLAIGLIVVGGFFFVSQQRKNAKRF